MDLVIAPTASARPVVRVSGAACRCVVALLLGLLWTEAPSVVVYVPLVTIAWWRADTRLEAGLIGALYQLGATQGLAEGAARYLDLSRPQGFVALGMLALVVGGGAAFCWLPNAAQRSWTQRGLAFTAWLAVTVSPIGLGALMVAHPLTAAGWLFPGTGWLGLAATAGLLLGSSSSAGAWILFVACTLGLLRGTHEELRAQDVIGIATHSEPARGEYDFSGQFRVALEAREAVDRASASIAVLPEGSAGTWTDSMRAFWSPTAARLREEGRFALIGASRRASDGLIDNAAIVIGAGEEIVIPQRLPIPVAMWRPWSSMGFRAHPLSSGVVRVGPRMLGVLVCWEGALVLPALLSAAAGAEVLVHQANHAWVGAAGLPTVLASRAWGLLFGLPVVIARNAQGGEDA